jgi:sugar phosphate isomerase/epimerase
LKHSRRDFLKTGSAAIACGSTFFNSTKLYAKTLKLPLGLELYSLRQQLPNDFNGTLKQVGALGYQEVEADGYFNHSVAEVKQAMQDAGLNLVSSHYVLDDLTKQFDQILEFNKELGVGYVICPTQGFRNPAPGQRILTLDDWRWNADQFNMLGEKFKAAGIQFGYHNHTEAFRVTEGVVPYDELMRLTDPSKVTMEMDCGWVVVGGGDPVEYLKKYPKRISMLHVKDFKMATPNSASSPASAPASPSAGPAAAPRRRSRIAELGQGSIDYRPIFEQAAKAGHITHCFVEQEGFDMPPMDSLKIDADYVRKLMNT